MTADQDIELFVSQYDEKVQKHVHMLRKLLLASLPGIIEQLDLPARMIGYCYGQKYAELICTVIPSKKGVKLGFNRGTTLPDPHHLLEGTGKISRYIDIRSEEQIDTPAVHELLANALALYNELITKPK